MKIEKCPFCGGTPILELFNDGFFDYARIQCCRVIFDWCEDKTGEQAIAAWNSRVQPENKPLTLDELKQMDGEPIWVVTLEGTDEPRWEIVVFAGKRGIDLICVLNGVETSDYADFDLYNYTWLAYRNKPAKEECYE